MSRRRTTERSRRSTEPAINNTRPSLNLLSQEQRDQVHRYALSILGRTGIRVDSPGVLRFLEDKLGVKG